MSTHTFPSIASSHFFSIYIGMFLKEDKRNKKLEVWIHARGEREREREGDTSPHARTIIFQMRHARRASVIKRSLAARARVVIRSPSLLFASLIEKREVDFFLLPLVRGSFLINNEKMGKEMMIDKGQWSD